MPYASWTGTGDDTTKQFAVPFPYVKKDHLVVTINYIATTAYSWVNSSTIAFDTLSADTSTQKASGAPKQGFPIIIKRGTSLGSALVDFVDGSTLTANDLDTANLQLLYATQELDDTVNAGVAWSPQGLDANNQPVINVQNPINAQDAATKTYVDSAITPVVNSLNTDTFKKDGSVAATGNFALGSNRITGLANPVDAQDAVTKAHYDAGIGTAAASATAASNSATASAASATDSSTSATLANSYKNAALAVARKTHMYGFKRNAAGNLLLDYSTEVEKDNVVYKQNDYIYKNSNHAFIGFNDLFYSGASPLITSTLAATGYGEAKWGADGPPLKIWLDNDGHLKMLLNYDQTNQAGDDLGDDYTEAYGTIDCSSTAKQYYSIDHPADVDVLTLSNHTAACTVIIEQDTRAGKSPLKDFRAFFVTAGNTRAQADVYMDATNKITFSVPAPDSSTPANDWKHLAIEGWRGADSDAANSYAMLGTVKKSPYLGDYSIRVTTP